MTPFAVAFLFVTGALLLACPRRWAALPLLLGTCYMTQSQGIEIGPFSFPFLRLLICVGMVRVLLRRERIGGGWTRLDSLLTLWAVWAVTSSLWHENRFDALIFRLGLVYNYCGLYILFRVFVRSLDEAVEVVRMTAIVLVPVAIEILYEKATGHNAFSILGGVPENSALREGSIRAQGPFRHAILAGTVGAMLLPSMVGLWFFSAKTASLGVLASLVMVFGSSSSGPLASVLAGILAISLWRFRGGMRTVRWLALGGYILLDIVMKAPAYYLIARIDLVSGSTGWHRARLIESAIQHVDEWGWAGTDHTRHWMPTGVSWSPQHTDITNHYLQMGVIGGVPLMVLFILALWEGFRSLGGSLHTRASNAVFKESFFIWTAGASLFTYSVSCLSVSFFDQSYLFVILFLAISSALRLGSSLEDLPAAQPRRDCSSDKGAPSSATFSA